MAADVSIAEAAVKFSQAFENYSGQRTLDNTSVRASVEGYYNNDFGLEYRNQNNSGADTGQMLSGLDATSLIMQYDFIS